MSSLGIACPLSVHAAAAAAGLMPAASLTFSQFIRLLGFVMDRTGAVALTVQSKQATRTLQPVPSPRPVQAGALLAPAVDSLNTSGGIMSQSGATATAPPDAALRASSGSDASQSTMSLSQRLASSAAASDREQLRVLFERTRGKQSGGSGGLSMSGLSRMLAELELPDDEEIVSQLWAILGLTPSELMTFNGVCEAVAQLRSALGS